MPFFRLLCCGVLEKDFMIQVRSLLSMRSILPECTTSSPGRFSLAREKRLGRRLENAVSNPELNRLLGTVGSVMTIGLSIESPFTNNNNTEQQKFIQLSNNLSLCYPQLAELF